MFYTVTLQNVLPENEDLISYEAFESGASGVSQKLNFNKKIYPEPEIIPSEKITLEVFFETTPESFIAHIKNQYPNILIEVLEQENKDWMEEWKKGFESFQLCQNYYIVPTWEKATFELKNKSRLSDGLSELIPIYIDPGMAFGTGTHETTQICSEFIFKIFQDLKNQKINSVLDVGTGTGILAFLAAKMGAQIILATDNDPEALRVASENAAINNLKLDLTEKDLKLLDGHFDLVVANIIDGVLLTMKTQLESKTNKYLIISGILDENDSDFISEFMKNSPFEIIQRVEKGEWVGYFLKKV